MDSGDTFLGLDIGTSAVKAVLVDGDQRTIASASESLATQRPRPGWSEQEPRDWWAALEKALAQVRSSAPKAFAAVRAIGLSGQMHGAVLVDAEGRPLRPAVLWNDARSGAECAELQAAFPGIGDICGVPPMPGLTAPKLLWLRKHEPDIVARTATILSPKDYIRLCLTGERCTDMSDAAGTLWLDEARRAWSAESLEASGVTLSQMPRLIEGTAVSGEVSPGILDRYGWRRGVIVAGGGGDSPVAAVGLGAVEDGDAYISIGTSSQLSAIKASYRPWPRLLVHAFSHAVPQRWLQIAAMLNGASCLAWLGSAIGRKDLGALLAETEAKARDPSRLLFLPYLAGERTPHGDAEARGALFGMDAGSSAADLTRAVLEGVAFSLREARGVLANAGTPLTRVGVTGGGARSAFWMQILSDVTGLELMRYDGSELGPAFGAARLARIAATGEKVSEVCVKPRVIDTFSPKAATAEAYAASFERYRRLYQALKTEFPKG